MNLPQEKGTAQQMLAQISKAPGAKAAELRATGLEEFLKSKGTAPVTRQEIQDYLADNRVQVNEVVLGKGQTLSPEAKRLADDANARMAEIYDEKMLPFFEQIVARGETLGGQEPYSVFSKLRGPLGRKAAKGDQEALAEIDALNLPPEIRDLVLEYGRNKNEYIKYTGQARRMGNPKFDKYNTPGGTNPREIYLALGDRTERDIANANLDAFTNRITQRLGRTGWNFEAMTPKEIAEYDRLNQAVLNASTRPPNPIFTAPSAHSVSPEADRNRLAHIFLDDRTDAQGKKVLFVQEMQSDWAQQGRDKGFAGEPMDYSISKDGNTWKIQWADGRFDVIPGGTEAEARAEANRAALTIAKEGTRPPAAPFVSTQQYQVMKDGKPLVTKNKKDQDVPHIYSSPEDAQRAAERFGGTVKDIGMQENTEGWVNLALKRVINEAVENGYDKVAFIKGEQAADKYSLRTFVDQITADRMVTAGDDMFVSITPKNSSIHHVFYVGPDGIIKEPISADVRNKFLGEPLSEVIGKEAAEKLLSTKVGESQTLKEEGLAFGGQGMKAFYDNILPKTANKLLAKLGSKIEPVDFGRTKSKETWVQGREHPFEVSQNASEPFEGRVTLLNRETGESRAFNTRDEANEYMAEALGHNTDQIHLGFKITPEMIDMVKTQGLPQFAAGGEVTKFIKRALA